MRMQRWTTPADPVLPAERIKRPAGNPLPPSCICKVVLTRQDRHAKCGMKVYGSVRLWCLSVQLLIR